MLTFAADAGLHQWFRKLWWACAHGYLKVASGGEYARADLIATGNPLTMLSHWHASVAKNAAAEFAISSELARGTPIRHILLCNLDGDNIMLQNFPTIAVALASSYVAVVPFLKLHFLFSDPVCDRDIYQTHQPTGAIEPKASQDLRLERIFRPPIYASAKGATAGRILFGPQPQLTKINM